MLQVGRGPKYYEHLSTGHYWSKDGAGHGGSVWKVYRREADGIHWLADADQYGDYLPDKYKAPAGINIPNKVLHVSRF